ncbi:MAG: hypothetical protein OEZ58_04940 [Gammaproteobacteria bacterium]|nr:hypothetical protein [Gammaproteobacteria bacterium]
MEKNLGKIICVMMLSSFCSSLAMADDNELDEREICQGSAPALLSVADFDGNGFVDENDIVLVKKAAKKDIYYAFYDYNADGEVNRKDVRLAKSDLGKSSSALDRQLAKLFHYNKQLQLVDSKQELRAMDFGVIAESLAGHGEHWSDWGGNRGGMLMPEGINVNADEKVMGLYWSIDAMPVFANGATDYPTPGGAWQDSRVIAFADPQPKYTQSDDEKWHTHGGLCLTVEPGPAPLGYKAVLNQHTSFNECQAIPSLIKTAGEYNAWFNIWMLHAWIFDLNPNGVFGNLHPCADANSPAEETINGDREVPVFFQHHMH